MTDEYAAGQVIGGRYRIIGRIGGGCMAVVYVAEDTTLGRRVAIKMLHRRFVEDAKFVERFRREAKSAAGLNHANIVGVYDWGAEGSQNYIVMEYVQGETLKDLIRRRGHLSGHTAVTICLELLAALGAAHANGVVHRDIKSQNILIDREGRAKVTDFGIAQGGEPGMTEAGSILGTAQYLAPEQARGEPVDERSDLYSVGVVLYEMLTGQVPFKGDSSVTVALKHVNELPTEPAKLVPGLPYALNQIVLKALAKDPNRRYGNAAEFAADLRAAEAGGPLRAATFDSAAERTQVLGAAAIAGEQPTRMMGAQGIPTRAARPAPPVKGRRRPPLWVWLVSAAVLIAVVVGAVLVYDSFGSGSGLPNVVGLDQQSAVRTLTTAGYKFALHHMYSDQFAPGFVTRQEPPAGTTLSAGGIVDLWVSSGSSVVTLDDLTHRTAADVAAYLTSNGLVGDPHTGRSSSVPDGQVYKQDPAAGVKVKRGSTVQYWVSRGAPQVTVPDVTGMTVAAAAASLNQNSLKVGTSTNQSSATVPSGEVISQSPGAGSKVDQNSTVDLVVSSGPSTTSPSPTISPTGTPIPVPDVVGKDQATAEGILVGAGFSVKATMVSSVQPPGTVVDQNPKGLDLAPPGSKVTIFVAA